MEKRAVTILLLIALLTSGCGTKGTLEVTVVGSDEKAAQGAEVWVWKQENFGRNPDYTQETGQDGIAIFQLPEGVYAISLSPPKYYQNNEEAGKNIIYASIKGDSVRKTLKLPEKEEAEQPDEATYREYFTELGIGRLKEGEKLPEGLEKNVKTFAQGESICAHGNLLKETTIQNSIYDVNTKEEVQPRGGPQITMETGGFAGCNSLDLQPGNYEYKVYAGDTLVGVFPFEIR